MALRLYNTMSRSVENFRPIEAGKVKIYTCGPTVYDYAHIGNWATYIRWDMLVRLLQLNGYDVTWVMNVTDVGHLVSDSDEGEDKLEKGARREGKTAWDVAKYYTDDFLLKMNSLNILPPTHIIKATATISQQIEFVRSLEEMGYTYLIDDGVYFDTAKLTDYGKLAHLHIEGLEAGARVELNQQKRHITDFALWKLSPPGSKRDMEWDSPWGKGFPGWHLECSVMAKMYLGETLDIHAGGIDHIPVHHTNEIAQSETLTGKPLAHYWLHSNHITIGGVKLSKSLGNAYTIQDVEGHGYAPLDLRLLFMQSHYRREASFSWDNMEAAKTRRKSLMTMAELRWQVKPVSRVKDDKFAAYKSDIKTALDDDINTPVALAILSQAEQYFNEHFINGDDLDAFIAFLEYTDAVFGLQLLTATPDISSDEKVAIADREKARKNKDFATSDFIRNKLLEKGIALRDTSVGPIWFRV